MTDGIIKGTGNSRYLKSVANALTLYPTHESLMEALAAGTLPIDLNGINPAGWETQGTALNKANLLTDALCTALGLATTATPTQAMDKLRQLVNDAQTGVNNGVKTELVSYVGTGTYGLSNPCSITFSFAPKVVLWLGMEEDGIFEPGFVWVSESRGIVIPSAEKTSWMHRHGFGIGIYSYGKVDPFNKTVYWYSTKGGPYQFNDENATYYFLGIS